MLSYYACGLASNFEQSTAVFYTVFCWVVINRNSRHGTGIVGIVQAL